MKDNISRISICPFCGKPYAGRLARSRKDNQTTICPDYGTRETLESIGVEPEEGERILDAIHCGYRNQM